MASWTTLLHDAPKKFTEPDNRGLCGGFLDGPGVCGRIRKQDLNCYINNIHGSQLPGRMVSVVDDERPGCFIPFINEVHMYVQYTCSYFPRRHNRQISLNIQGSIDQCSIRVVPASIQFNRPRTQDPLQSTFPLPVVE